MAEIAAEKPRYKGSAYCTSCHAQQVAEWSNGVHNRPDIGKVVKCEVCHGPGGGRDPETTYLPPTTGPDHPKNLKMIVPTDTRQLCTLCHERMTGRPLQQRQIAVADHAGTQQCTVCHNPHSPRLNLVSAASTAPAGDAAAGKAKAAACVGCHGAEGVSVNLPGPTLAAQRDAYLQDALKAYVTGGRSDPMMSASAQGLSGDDVANVAAYFAGAKCVSALDAAKQATPPGKATASKCTACHGARWKQRQSFVAQPRRAIPRLSRQGPEIIQGRSSQERSDGRGREGLKRCRYRKCSSLLRRRDLQVRRGKTDDFARSAAMDENERLEQRDKRAARFSDLSRKRYCRRRGGRGCKLGIFAGNGDDPRSNNGQPGTCDPRI